MTRKHVIFSCAGTELVGTLDAADGSVGLLIVSGGNELRSGAWNGQAMIAARLAARGFPVFRFDRRGIGDSAGENTGFRGSSDDVRAALAAFRQAAPHITRIVGWGNCDAASALMLGSGLGCDGLVLSNPWTFEDEAGETEAEAPQVLRAHYLQRLRDPAAIARLLSGKISLGGLVRSLRGLAKRTKVTGLTREMRAELARFDGPVRFLLAGRDRTAKAFAGQWGQDERTRTCLPASHSFAEQEAQTWLENQLTEALSSQPA